MPNKIPSEIIEIVLSERSYSGTNTTIYPTFINYFFGNNGTGKTTLAKAIKNGVGIEYAPGKTAADYNSLVFDQDFITQNMHNYHNMPGVFTMTMPRTSLPSTESNTETSGIVLNRAYVLAVSEYAESKRR